MRSTLCDGPDGPPGRRAGGFGPIFGLKPPFLLSMLIVSALEGVCRYGRISQSGESWRCQKDRRQQKAAAEQGNCLDCGSWCVSKAEAWENGLVMEVEGLRTVKR